LEFVIVNEPLFFFPGALRDYTYSYSLGFYVAGAVTLLAGIVMIAIPLKNCIYQHKTKEYQTAVLSEL